MKCGIVILNYNSFELSTKLVDKCYKMKSVDKIILIDNNSSDDFTSFLGKYSSKVEYIKNNINNGYAAGNNLGLKKLYNEGYDIGFIANPDVCFSENVIINILNFFEKNRGKYGAVSCKRTLHDDYNTRQYWMIPTYSSALFESLYFYRKFNTKKLIRNTVKEVEQHNNSFFNVEVVGGAFFGMDLEIMNRIGFLDEGTFLWYEENILAYKLKNNGYNIGLLTNCVYQHNHIKKGHGNKKFTVFLKSKKYFCKKYLKINTIQTILLDIFDFVGNIEEKIICLIKW